MRVRASFVVAIAVFSAVAVLSATGVLPPGTLPARAASDEDAALSAISVTRITGADRYDVAVHIAQATRTRADVVYLASGSDFPDALSAGPAVVHEQGVLLLVPPTGITFTIGVELASLAPKRVVIVGGPLSVPETIVGEVRSILGPTFRWRGSAAPTATT